MDYGNEAAVPADFVKRLDITMITHLPAQAIPCVLNDVTIKPLRNDHIDKVMYKFDFIVKVKCGTLEM